MTRNGRAYQRQLWAPATDAIGGGVLPTPKAADGQRGRDKARARPDTKGRELATVVRDLLPTPVARDDGKTPAAHMAMKQRMKGGPRQTITSLSVLARNGMQQPDPQLLTPCASDHKGRTNWQAAGRNGPQRVPDLIPTGAGMYLNPSFVEEMMGFPVGWTA